MYRLPNASAQGMTDGSRIKKARLKAVNLHAWGPRIFPVAVLTVLLLIAYWPGLSAPFYFDDAQNIVDAENLHWESLADVSLGSLLESHLPRRLVSNFSFAINHLVLGNQPSGYRIVNWILHLITGVLLYGLCRAYFSTIADIEDRQARRVSLLIAAAFVVHPLNIQAVTYIVQRMAILACMFGLAFLLCLLKAIQHQSVRKRKVYFGVAWMFFLLAIFSKENAVVLIGIVALVVLKGQYMVSGWCIRRDWILAAVGLITLAAVPILLYSEVLSSILEYWSKPLPGRSFSMSERLLSQPQVQLQYLGLFLWPSLSRLNLDHDISTNQGLLGHINTLGSSLVIATLLLVLLVQLRKRPYIALPFLSYFFLHAIESGPLNLELMFEHRMYFPVTMLLMGLGAIVVCGGKGYYKPAICVGAVVIVALTAVSFQRNQVWAEEERMLNDIATKSPRKFRPLYNLGTWYGTRGKYELADQWLTRALESIVPGGAESQMRSIVLVNLGNTYLMRGEIERSLEMYREAYRADPNNRAALENLRRFGAH